MSETDRSFIQNGPCSASSGRPASYNKSMYQRAETAVTLAGVEACRAFFADCMTEPGGDGALWVAHVNDEARCIHLASYPGEAAASDLPIRSIVAEAALLGSTGVILAQHRSPSMAGVESTRRLALAAEAMALTVLDHLLFSGNQCSSMRRSGLL